MKKYIFYLRPTGQATRHQSRVYFCVIIAKDITLAARKFSNIYGSIYSGMMKVTENKYQLFYTQGKGQYKEELMYIVIEEEKNIFENI
ncbi:hypothetical protein [Sporolactobacillus putidus]|uniref:Uncharacterized protein n=1 Tax=Sporolactobacillus putidus TaxID=492735 RepID=A0A917VZR8_9BACL|nr:hypothetical protein [Sporolactobacillus putidus]GGL50542.1 hypothetical protein GCM10007968_13460 [Sporolactobacillus putidus]